MLRGTHEDNELDDSMKFPFLFCTNFLGGIGYAFQRALLRQFFFRKNYCCIGLLGTTESFCQWFEFLESAFATFPIHFHSIAVFI